MRCLLPQSDPFDTFKIHHDTYGVFPNSVVDHPSFKQQGVYSDVMHGPKLHPAIYSPKLHQMSQITSINTVTNHINVINYIGLTQYELHRL